jgi:hypothetical protein
VAAVAEVVARYSVGAIEGRRPFGMIMFSIISCSVVTGAFGLLPFPLPFSPPHAVCLLPLSAGLLLSRQYLQQPQHRYITVALDFPAWACVLALS